MPEKIKNTLSAQQVIEEASAPVVWGRFDAPWYRRRYQQFLSDKERQCDDLTLEQIWQSEGVKNKRSPNRFFDEAWYLNHNDDVLKAVISQNIFESGFQHYNDIGYWNCTPHWLFDQEEYLRQNDGVSYQYIQRKGFKNPYDYFLKIGDKERQTPHKFFDQSLFIQECLKDDIDFNFTQGGYEQYLSFENPQMGLVRTSWYFDPKWYVERYPDIKKLLEAEQYVTPLHHYLECDSPQDFDPNPFFSEHYYCEQHKDVQKAIEEGSFRNGYEHFLKYGVYENRRPHENVDLADFASRYHLKRVFFLEKVQDVFALWVKTKEEDIGDTPADATAETYQKLAIEHVEIALPSLCRSPLSFIGNTPPDISVIILSEGDYLSVTASLIALYQQYNVSCEICISSNGNQNEKRRLQQFSRGVNLLYSDEFLTEEKLLLHGLQNAQSPHVVVLRAGMQPAPGALHYVRDALVHNHVDGGSGLIIGADGYVREAGCRLWRDGSITSCGRNLEASDHEVNYKRILEVGQEGFFFGPRSEVLKHVEHVDQCGLEAGFAPLFLACRAQHKTLYYDPRIIVRDLNKKNVPLEMIHRQRKLIRQYYSHVLLQHPLPGGGEWRDPQFASDVIMIFPYLPSLREGGTTRRIMQQIKEFQRKKWNVTVVSLTAEEDDRLIQWFDYSQKVECIVESGHLLEFLQKRKEFIRILWINGTSTLSMLAPMLKDNVLCLPLHHVILDTVTQNGGSLRAVEAHLRRLVGRNDDQERLIKEVKEELADAWICQRIIANDDFEAHLIKRAGLFNVSVISPVVTPRPSLKEHSFHERHGLFFPLCIYRPGDAVHDGFDWFCLNVVSYLREMLEEDVPIWISGYHHPSVDLGFYEQFATIEGLVEPVSECSLMARCRVLISPVRALSTQATEIIEGATYGIPSVIGSPLMDHLRWEDHQEALDGGINDPKHFAKAIAELYTNETLWCELQKKARERVKTENSLKAFQHAFADVLHPSSDVSASDRPCVSFSQNISHPRRFDPAPLRLRPSFPDEQTETLNETTDTDDDTQNDAFLKTHLGVDLNG